MRYLKNDAEIALLARTWEVAVQDLNAALGRVPPPIAAGEGWHPYPDAMPPENKMYDVRLKDGTYARRRANSWVKERGYGFSEYVNSQMCVVAWRNRNTSGDDIAP